MTEGSKGDSQYDCMFFSPYDGGNNQNPNIIVSHNSLITPPHLPFNMVAEILCRLTLKHILQLDESVNHGILLSPEIPSSSRNTYFVNL